MDRAMTQLPSEVRQLLSLGRAAVLGSDGRLYDGATRPPGGLHLEKARSISPVKRPGERRWLRLLNLVVMWEELLHA